MNMSPPEGTMTDASEAELAAGLQAEERDAVANDDVMGLGHVRPAQPRLSSSG